MYARSNSAMLKDKVCIVTGSSAGLGAAIAVKFAKENAEGIILHGRNVDGLNDVKSQCVQNGSQEKNVLIVVGDITDETVQQKLLDDTINRFGRLDVIVNNAGIMNMSTFMSSNMETFDQLWNTNVRSLVSLTKLCVPHLVKTKGNVVNISSGLALKPEPFAVFYNMGKAAIGHFTKCLALELGPVGVRVNCVNPGYIPGTSLVTRHGIPAESLKSHDEDRKLQLPMRQYATPEDVAEGVAWIAGRAVNTTGHFLPIDGGFSIS